MYGNYWFNRIKNSRDEDLVFSENPHAPYIEAYTGTSAIPKGTLSDNKTNYMFDFIAKLIPENMTDNIKSFLREKLHFSSFQLIMGGFMLVILIGALLLRLPFASNPGADIDFLDALFTATSATCVTGLVVADTVWTWTLFGQIVILTLIQIGGMGIVTIAILLFVLSGKKIGLRQRSIMQESISAPNIGGIVKMTGFIVKGTLFFEFLGALLMLPVMTRDFGPVKGFWYALFHAISAFCNAGFDLMGAEAPFSSLTDYAGDPLINITIMALIIIGGIGFFTWSDVYKHKLNYHTYSMQSKAILNMTLALILIPAVIFFMTEYRDMPIKERLLASIFQSVTPRTAGFNTTDYSTFSDKNILLTIVLMLTGGASGSTAGGFKVTTNAYTNRI